MFREHQIQLLIQNGIFTLRATSTFDLVFTQEFHLFLQELLLLLQHLGFLRDLLFCQ